VSRWFRSYADTHRNPKVARLSDSDFRLWHQLLCMASENDGILPPADDIKRVLNRRLDHLLEALKRLISGGLIDPLGDGYAPRNWSKRQYKSDTSTERVKKHREKCNVSETPPDTETDTETEESGSKEPSARALWSSPPVSVGKQTWADFKQNRKSKRLGFTVSSYRNLESQLSRISAQTGIPPPALLEHAAAQGWGGIYDPNERKPRNGQADRPADGLSSTARAAIAVFGPPSTGHH
jgi:hypothetical protein